MKNNKKKKEEVLVAERLKGLLETKKGINKSIDRMANKSFVDKRRGSR